MTVRIRINGEEHDLSVPALTPLLTILRDHLSLKGAKQACGRGECGACTVLIGGKPVLSCLTLAGRVRDDVITVEALGPEWAALRQAFADCGGFQCGYCTSGQIMRAVALLGEGLPADSAEARLKIRYEMSGNVCRCTGYNGIVDAVLHVARMRDHQPAGTNLDAAP
jgi:aerobic-type carbon monoxide dehydrogenase small subunit (CoxS/CutS family)